MIILEPVSNNGSSGLTDGLTLTKRKFPMEKQLWAIPEWKPELGSDNLYEETLGVVKKCVVFRNPIDYKLYVLWAISTWKGDAWYTISFLTFLAALRNSGKSRALKTLVALSYRGVDCAGLTGAALPRATHNFGVSLFIDELQTKLKPPLGEFYADFLKNSYTRGSKYITCDKNDQHKLIVYDNFGPKAFAAERKERHGLYERCIDIQMNKETPEYPNLGYAQKEFAVLRSKLLNYKYKTDNPNDLGLSFELEGRTRELYEMIVATAMHLDIPYDDIVEHALEREKSMIGDLQDTIHGDILAAIDAERTYPGTRRVSIGRIVELAGISDAKHTAHRQVGYALRDLGIIKKRICGERHVYFDENEKVLEALFKRYEI